MRDTFGTIYWGSSATTPIVPTSLQHSEITDQSLGIFDFSDIAGAGFWAIAVPANLNPINTVRFNDSPIDLLPVTESTTVTFHPATVTTAAYEMQGVGVTQGIVLDNALLFSPTDVLTISDGTNSMKVQIVNIENVNRVSAVTTQLITGVVGACMATGATVGATHVVTYTVYRGAESFPGFTDMSITTAGGP